LFVGCSSDGAIGNAIFAIDWVGDTNATLECIAFDMAMAANMTGAGDFMVLALGTLRRRNALFHG